LAFLASSFALFSVFGSGSARALGPALGSRLALRGQNISFAQGVTRSAALENRVRGGTDAIVNNDPNFASLRQGSFAVESETTVTGRGAEGDECTSNVLFLQRDTYTARLARITFAVDDSGRTHTRSINANFQPPVGPPPSAVAQNVALEGTKGHAFSFQERNLRSQTPPANILGANEAALTHERAQPHHSWWYAKGLANTSAPEFPSAVQGTQQVNSILYAALGSSALRDSSGTEAWRQSTKAEITDLEV